MSDPESYEIEYEVEYDYEEVEYETDDSAASDEAKDDDDSSSDWSDSSSSDEEEVEIDADAYAGKSKYEIALLKWGIREEDKNNDIKPKKEKKEKKKKIVITEDESAAKGGIKKVAFDPMEEYTPDDLVLKLVEFSVPKGRKVFGDQEVLASLKPLLSYAKRFSPGVRLELMSNVWFLRWNIGRKGAFERVDDEVVEANLDTLEEIYELYKDHIEANPTEFFAELEKAFEHEDLEKKFSSYFTTLVFACEQLDQELCKAMKLLGDRTTSEYMRVQSLLTDLLALTWKVVSISLRKETNVAKTRYGVVGLCVRLAFHSHFLDDEAFTTFMTELRTKAPTLPNATDSREWMNSLMRLVHLPVVDLQLDDPEKAVLERHRVFMKLMMVFNLAQGGCYRESIALYRGADLYDEVINSGDIELQIFVNRAIVSLGLLRFRLGKIHEAHQFLQEICAFAKYRELLAQNVSRPHVQRTEETLRAEKRRLLPPHMHILGESIEIAHNVSAMLIISTICARQNSMNLHTLRNVNRHFVHMYDVYSRQLVTTVPESPRDIVMYSMDKLIDGQWKEVLELLGKLEGLDVETLRPEVAKVALKCFICKYGPFYKTLIVSELAERFELSEADVVTVISFLISNRHIHGSMSQGVLYLEQDEKEATKIHRHLTEKLSLVMDSNEALMAFKRKEGGVSSQFAGMSEFM